MAYYNVQGHSRSFIGVNRKPVYYFLNRNLGPISHSFWDTVTYWLKNANFLYPLSFSALTGSDPFSICGKSMTDPETRVFQAADCED